MSEAPVNVAEIVTISNGYASADYVRCPVCKKIEGGVPSLYSPGYSYRCSHCFSQITVNPVKP